MELEIVWRNPLPLPRIEHTLHKLGSDEFSAVYLVTDSNLTQEFELIAGVA